MKPSQWSLATRVIAAASLLLAVLLIIVIFTQVSSARDRRDAEVESAQNLGRTVAGLIAAFARDLETTMLAASIALGAQERELSQETAGPNLARLKAEYPLLRALFLTDTEGVVIAADSGVGIGTPLADRPYMQELQSGRVSVWGRAVLGLESGEVTATYGRAVLGDGGGTRGYLIAAFYPARLSELLVGSVPDDADVSILDSAGTLMHSTQYPELGGEARDLSADPDVQNALAGQIIPIKEEPGIVGDDERFGIVTPVPSTGWAVAFTRPYGPLQSDLREQFFSQVGQVTAAVLVIGALLTLATRRIARPLGDLAGAAGAIARGERPELPPTSGEGEIGRLAAAMRSMEAAVADREDGLRREMERRAILADSSRAFAEAGRDLNEELQIVAERVASAIGDGCSVLLRSNDGEWLNPVAMHHTDEQIRDAGREMNREPIRVGAGLSGRAAATGVAQSVRGASAIRETVDTFRQPFIDRLGMHCLTSLPIRAHGRVIGVLAVWRDRSPAAHTLEDVELLQEIADRAGLAIENARLLRESQEYAAAAERSMHAHDEFVALISHDLKGPLASIDSTAQLVRSRLARGAQVEPTVMDGVRAAVARAIQEIDALLDVARSQSGEALELDRQPDDLVRIVQESAASFRPLSDHHTIEVQADTPAIPGSWDAPRLGRAFNNLINNAIKYSPEGGVIAVRIGTVAQAGGEMAEVSVADTGVGIAPDALPRIFDRFYRAANVASDFPGTGLGLTGAATIVQAHGGGVDVHSRLGEGSTFTVRLPIIPQSARPEAETSP